MARNLIKFLFATFLVAASVLSCVYSEEQGLTFPSDVQKFVTDREACDHFRGEPRDFDESYKRENGKRAELEEAERAAFLEKMTQKTCYRLDDRLRFLNRKYCSNKFVFDKLAQYEYLEIGSGYFHIHKDFPNAKLIQEKLIAKGFSSSNVQLMEGVDRHGLNWNQPLPAKLTIQIGSMVDVFPAQLAIETLLEYGPKDIGVVVLPKDNIGLGLTMVVGSKPVGNNHVYTDGEIQSLLTSGLSEGVFRKFAK